MKVVNEKKYMKIRFTRKSIWLGPLRRITDFSYVPTAMCHCTTLIVIMHHSKAFFQF